MRFDAAYESSIFQLKERMPRTLRWVDWCLQKTNQEATRTKIPEKGSGVRKKEAAAAKEAAAKEFVSIISEV